MKHLENHVPPSVIHKVEAEVKQATVVEASEAEEMATPKMATPEEAKFMKALNDLIKEPVPEEPEDLSMSQEVQPVTAAKVSSIEKTERQPNILIAVQQTSESVVEPS